jgi:hypothetical protein
VVKRILVVGAFLATSLLVVGASAAFGIVLGTRAIVVSATAVNPAAPIASAPTGHAGSGAVLVAMQHGRDQ